jgi:hypothetical protein
MVAKAMSEIWSKLVDASENKVSLGCRDAEDILALLSSLTQVDINSSRDEVALQFRNIAGIDRDDDLEDSFVAYLTTHYAKTNIDLNINESFHRASKSGKFHLPPHSDPNQKVELLSEHSAELTAMLKKIDQWSFDVFDLVNLTPFALVMLVENALHSLGISETFIDFKKLRSFMGAIQDAYLTTPYHNHIHACDVAQTAYYFCTTGNLIRALNLNTLSYLALIISAAIHDVGHPGFTNKFIIATKHELAITYNDRSPLENMHLAVAFRLIQVSEHDFTTPMCCNNNINSCHCRINIIIRKMCNG